MKFRKNILAATSVVVLAAILAISQGIAYVQAVGNTQLAELSVNRTLSGKMTDSNGNPLPYLGIEVHANNNPNTVINSAWADADGNYSIQLPAGNYTNIHLRTFITGYSSIGGVDVAYPDLGLPGDLSLDLTDADLTKNFALSLTKMNITVKDSAGNPEVGAHLTYLFDGIPNNGFVDMGKTPVNSGTDNYRLQILQITNNAEHPTTDSNGNYTVYVPKDGNFPAQTSPHGLPLCVTYSNNTKQCNPLTLNTTNDVNVVFQEGQAVKATPVPPTGLRAEISAEHPQLVWNSVVNANAYKVYRNSEFIGTSTTNSYTDTTAPSTGDLDYYVTATNEIGESAPSKTFSVTTPDITSSNSTSIGRRQVIDFTVTTSGTPTPTLTISGNLPAGISFSDNNNGTGTFSGMTSATSNGTYPIAITATGSGRVAVQNFTLTVTTAASAPNDTFSNTGSNELNAYYGDALTPITITATGYPAPTLSKGGTMPNGVSFHNNNNGTATISGTPSGSASGPYNITVTATNSSGSYSETYTIYIFKAPSINSIPNRNLRATVGTPYSLTISTAGYEIPALYQIDGSMPSGLSLVDSGNGTVTISGAPEEGSGGSYPFTLTASNSQGSVDKTITIIVNEAPAITSNNTYTVTRNTPMVPFTVTTTGYPAARLTATGLPLGVTFNDNNNGTATISGTPISLQATTRTITIRATNSTGTVTQTFSLVIQ